MTVVDIGATSTVCLSGSVIALIVDYAEEVAVQMHGMVHHGAVDHDEAYDLAFADTDRVAFRKRLVVEKPYIALHISIEGKTDFADRSVPGKSSTRNGPQFGVWWPWTARIHTIQCEVFGCGDVSSEEAEIRTMFFVDP